MPRVVVAKTFLEIAYEEREKRINRHRLHDFRIAQRYDQATREHWCKIRGTMTPPQSLEVCDGCAPQ